MADLIERSLLNSLKLFTEVFKRIEGAGISHEVRQHLQIKWLGNVLGQDTSLSEETSPVHVL